MPVVQLTAEVDEPWLTDFCRHVQNQGTASAIIALNQSAVDLVGRHGYGAQQVKMAYECLRELCEELEEPPVSALVGLWQYYLIRAQYDKAEALAERLEDAGQNRYARQQALRARGEILFYLGDFDVALACFDEVLRNPVSEDAAQSIPASAHDPVALSLAHGALAHWAVGNHETSDQWMTEARRRTRPDDFLNHVLIQHFSAVQCQFKSDMDGVRRFSEQTASIAHKCKFPIWSGLSTIMLNWASPRHDARRCHDMNEGLNQFRSTGARIAETLWMTLVAESHRQIGQLDRAQHKLNRALQFVSSRAERFFESQIYRSMARLELDRGEFHGFEQHLVTARETAQSQGATGWELEASSEMIWALEQKLERERAVRAELELTLPSRLVKNKNRQKHGGQGPIVNR